MNPELVIKIFIRYGMMKRNDNIPGYPGYYVSRVGKVYSRKSLPHDVWKELTYRYTYDNRVTVLLTNTKYNKKRFKVSRLVALVHIPNPYNKHCVCHKDNNPKNNKVSNLYWGTHRENMDQMSLDGRASRYGSNCIQSWVKEELVKLYSEGFSVNSLSKGYGLSRKTVRRIVKLSS